MNWRRGCSPWSTASRRSWSASNASWVSANRWWRRGRRRRMPYAVRSTRYARPPGCKGSRPSAVTAGRPSHRRRRRLALGRSCRRRRCRRGHGTCRVWRFVRAAQRRHPLPVHVLADRSRVVLRAVGRCGEQGRRRLSDVAAQAARRAVRRQAHAAWFVFRRDDVSSYLANLEHALDATEAELGERGTVDLFGLTRRLGHRMGLASWAGPGCADGDAFERLVAAFDTLDGSDAFVHPDALAAVAASGMRDERAALDDVAAVIEDALRQHDSEAAGTGLFARIVEAWGSEPAEVRTRGIAMDVALIHIASMSNLMAALGWALVDLLLHPDQLDLVVRGDRDLAQRCALESTRLAQRSIMARAVLEPVAFDTGAGVVDVPPGWTIATLLPLLNRSAAPGLQQWDPA